MTNEARQWDLFLELHQGMPRQGPGDDDVTAAAIALCTGLPEAPAILDIGCGPGAQTLVLARETGGHVTAVDLYPQFLSELAARAALAGVADRVTTVEADMGDLPFEPGSFDLLWSEGAAYVIGVPQALAAWKPLMKPGGFIGISDMVWLTDDPPAEARAYFAQEYPALTTIARRLADVEAAGYRSLGHLVLPDAAWWGPYYTPLEARLAGFAAAHAGDEDAEAVVAMSREEIENRRRFGDAYGYALFIARLPD